MSGGGGGSGGEFINERRDVIVIQYLETTMAEKLLCKFPDNSAFDFDYSQSSIWSPLIARRYDAASIMLKKTPKSALKGKLLFDDGGDEDDGIRLEGQWRLFKKITFSNIKRKVCAGMNFNFNLPKKRLKFGSTSSKVGAVDSSPLSPKSSRKKHLGWENVLRMKSKQFKKTKKDQNAGTRRMKLSDYLQFENF